MVYSGHPSRGCQMCRTRRIKCDETKPTCNQCAKSRRVCPGYKDQFDLVFRNETEATERRVRRANRKATASRASKELSIRTPSSQSGTPSSSSSKSSARSSPISSPTFSIDERAAHHFVSNYVLIPPQGTERGYFQFVIPLIKTENPSPHFKLAFEACALAYFCNRMSHTAHLEKEALVKYVKALAATGQAIRDPVCSKQDATIAAVLLLSLFENITSRHLGMFAWSSHTEGAIQLVQNRGKDLLKTNIGRDIFVAVRTQQIIHSFSSGQPATRDVDFWIKDATKDVYATDMQRITLEISELKTEANRLLVSLTQTPANAEIIKTLIRKCQMKDQELVQWAENVPKSYQPKTVYWISHEPGVDYSKAEALPGRIDAFQDLWITSVWITMRCARLVLGSMIVRSAAWAYSPMDYRETWEYAHWSRICADIISDLCAAIPYQLGWFRNRTDLLEQVDLTSYCCGDDAVAKGLSGYFVTWPLSCILTQDYSTPTQRLWAKGRLEHIASELGVGYAKMLTHVNIRVPSMLIKRDDMAASGSVDTSAVNFEKILSNRIIPVSGIAADWPSAGSHERLGAFDTQQRQAMEAFVSNFTPFYVSTP